jgi:hypothetical protein
MERLYKPTEDGGAPYKNQDFFQFLQQNHIISYSAFLDEINDRSSGNCGIILKGITESHVFTQQLIDTIEPGSTPIPTGGLFSDYLALPSPRIIGDDNTTFLTSWANGQHLYYLDDNGLYVYVGQILTILTDKSLILTAPPINTPLPLSVLVSSEKPPIQVNSLSSQQVFWNLQNSLVYIDGEFLDPAPWLATQSAFDNYGVGGTFYIHKYIPPTGAQAIETKTQRFTKVYDYATDVIENSYYDISSSNPGRNHIEVIETRIDTYALSGTTLGAQIPNIVDYIKNRFTGEIAQASILIPSTYILGGRISGTPINLGTSRYFSRLLKYYLADEDDLQMTFDLRFFNHQGLGFGPMFGFKIQELGGRFLLGYATGSNTTPTSIANDRNLGWSQKSTYTNYSKLGNIGGEERTFLVEDHLPTHNHGSQSGTPSNDMSHTHWVPVADALIATNDGPPGQGESDTPGQLINERGFPTVPWDIVRLGKGTSIYGNNLGDSIYVTNISHHFHNPSNDGTTYDVDENGNRTETPKNLSDHTHPIYPGFVNGSYDTTSSSLDDLRRTNARHNNAPPFVTITYYVKYNPY